MTGNTNDICLSPDSEVLHDRKYKRYLPLPRLGEGRGEALAVGSWGRPPPRGRYRAGTSPRGIGVYTSQDEGNG